MEVPIIHRLNDFQVGLNSLQNPSFLSQITSSLSGIQSVSIAYNFCKWGAVILALVATFGSLINRVKIFIIRFRRDSPSLPSIPLVSQFDDDDYSSSDEEDETCSLSSSLSSEFEEDDEDEPTPSSSSFNWHPVDDDFRVRDSGPHVDDQLQSGSVRLQRRRSIVDIFSLSEIANSKSVVKLWDSIGFGLGLDFDGCDFFAGSVTPAVSSSSPAVVVSAGTDACGKTSLKIWDTRLRRRIPAAIGEWGPNPGNIVGVGFSGVEKVYVRDDVHYGVTVGDMRNVRSPLSNVTECDVDTWWDADAVIVSNESYGDEPRLQRKKA